MKTVKTEISDDLHAMLKADAKSRKMKMGDVLAEALETVLRSQGEPVAEAWLTKHDANFLVVRGRHQAVLPPAAYRLALVASAAGKSKLPKPLVQGFHWGGYDVLLGRLAAL